MIPIPSQLLANYYSTVVRCRKQRFVFFQHTQVAAAQRARGMYVWHERRPSAGRRGMYVCPHEYEAIRPARLFLSTGASWVVAAAVAGALLASTAAMMARHDGRRHGVARPPASGSRPGPSLGGKKRTNAGWEYVRTVSSWPVERLVHLGYVCMASPASAACAEAT